VASVQAHADPWRPAKQVDDFREVFETMPEIGALAGGVLEQHARVHVRARREDVGKPVGDQSQSARLGPRGERSRMHHEAVKAQRFSAVELVAQ
jgi:hypothetical protein